MEKDLEIQNSTIGIEVEFIREEKFTLSQIKKELQKLLGVKIRLEDKHHSDFVPTEEEFKMEPDFSGGKNLVELVTGPMDYKVAREKLQFILKWLRETKDVYTTNRCGLHININYPNKSYISDIDILRFILTFDEEEVYKRFPNRRDNIYTKSIKSIAPIHNNFDFTSIKMAKAHFRYPNTKYFGINFEKLAKNYLEFRYIGGKDYEKKSLEIMELIDYFLVSLKNSYYAKYDNKLQKKLEDIVNKKKDLYLAGKSYFHFKNIFRNIKLLIDTKSNEETIKSFFPKIWDRLFPLLDSVIDLKYTKKGVINYDSDNSILEFQGFYFNKSIINSMGCIFYDCKIENSVMESEQLYYCKIKNSDLINCIANVTNIKSGRIKDGNYMSCEIDDTYINGKNLYIEQSKISKGIFREGSYANCIIEDDVEVIDAEEVKSRENN